jgi:hypothetical protein
MDLYIYDSWFSFIYEIAFYISDVIYKFFGNDWYFIGAVFLIFVFLNVYTRYLVNVASVDGSGMREFFDQLIKRDLFFKLILGGVLFVLCLYPINITVHYTGNKLIPAEVIKVVLKDIKPNNSSSSGEDSAGNNTEAISNTQFTTSHKLPLAIAVPMYAVDLFLFSDIGLISNTMKPFFDKYKEDMSYLLTSYINIRQEKEQIFNLADNLHKRAIQNTNKMGQAYRTLFNSYANIKLESNNSKTQKDIEKLIVILYGIQAGYTKEGFDILNILATSTNLSATLNTPEVLTYYNKLINDFKIEVSTENNQTVLTKKTSTGSFHMLKYLSYDVNKYGDTYYYINKYEDTYLLISFLYNTLNNGDTSLFNTYYSVNLFPVLNYLSINKSVRLANDYNQVIQCLTKKESNCSSVTFRLSDYLTKTEGILYDLNKDKYQAIADESEIVVRSFSMVNFNFEEGNLLGNISKQAKEELDTLTTDINSLYINILETVKQNLANQKGAYNYTIIIPYIDSLITFFSSYKNYASDMLSMYETVLGQSLLSMSDDYFEQVVSEGNIFSLLKVLDTDGISLSGTAAAIFNAIAWFISWALLIFSYLGLVYFFVIRALNFLVYLVLWFLYFFKAIILSDIKVLKTFAIDWLTFRAYDLAIIIGIGFSFAFQVLLMTLSNYGSFILKSTNTKSLMFNLVSALCVFLNLQIMRFIYQNISKIVSQSDNVFADSLKRVVDTGVASLGSTASLVGGIMGLSTQVTKVFGRNSKVETVLKDSTEIVNNKTTKAVTDVQNKFNDNN